jgi:hypothetical protein
MDGISPGFSSHVIYAFGKSFSITIRNSSKKIKASCAGSVTGTASELFGSLKMGREKKSLAILLRANFQFLTVHSANPDVVYL